MSNWLNDGDFDPEDPFGPQDPWDPTVPDGPDPDDPNVPGTDPNTPGGSGQLIPWLGRRSRMNAYDGAGVFAEDPWAGAIETLDTGDDSVPSLDNSPWDAGNEFASEFGGFRKALLAAAAEQGNEGLAKALEGMTARDFNAMPTDMRGQLSKTAAQLSSKQVAGLGDLNSPYTTLQRGMYEPMQTMPDVAARMDAFSTPRLARAMEPSGKTGGYTDIFNRLMGGA